MKGGLPHEHLVRHAAERKDVTPSGDFVLARGLLGTQVLRDAHRHADLTHAYGTRLRDCERDAPVGDEHSFIVREDDAVRLQVPVREVAVVRVLQRFGDGARDLDGLGDFEPTFSLEAIGERLAIDDRRRVVQRRVGRAEVVNGEDVRVRQLGGDLHLLDECFSADRFGGFGPENPERDVAVEFEIVRLVNRALAAGAEFAIQTVPHGDGKGDARRILRRGPLVLVGWTRGHAGIPAVSDRQFTPPEGHSEAPPVPLSGAQGMEVEGRSRRAIQGKWRRGCAGQDARHGLGRSRWFRSVLGGQFGTRRLPKKGVRTGPRKMMSLTSVVLIIRVTFRADAHRICRS